jgi:hypothetical protein
MKYDLEAKDYIPPVDVYIAELREAINAAWSCLVVTNGDMAQLYIEQDIWRMEDELSDLLKRRDG